MTNKDLISKYDLQNQFQIIRNSYLQIQTAWEGKLESNNIDVSKIQNIIVAGMGGSAIGGELLPAFLGEELKFPFQVNRNYSLPNYINENTLFIASSYSGFTEETLSGLNEAIERNAQIICITTGGKMDEIAKLHKLPIFKLMKGFQPRFALYSSFFALLKILQELGLVGFQNSITNKIISNLKEMSLEFSKETNEAEQFSRDLIGFIPIIYGVSGKTDSVAVRIKGQFNENSKLHAFYNNFAELNHNEIIGWESFNANQINAKVIIIEDESYHPQIQKRIAITKQLISKMGCEVKAFASNKSEFKERLFDIIYFADWVTFYLAVQRGKDPIEIDNIHYLKENLQ
jgi:glucose/mannose-6-phosphate isomerase